MTIIKQIPLNQIKPGRYQPRQQFDYEKLLDLATSIRDEGLFYPLLVFLDQDGKYELIGGERRWRASCALHLANIGDFNGGLADAVGITAAADWPEVINNGVYYHFSAYTVLVNEQPADIAPDTQRVRAVADNLQRADLTPFEEAQAVYDLKTQLNLSIRQVAAKVGKSKSWVEDRLKLMKLDPAAAQAVAAAAADDNAPSLDMTVIREVARKLPEELQAPVLAALHPLAGKTPTDDLKKLVGHLATFCDPKSWSQPSDFAQPTHPSIYNRGRMLARIIASLPPATLIERALKLHGGQQYNSYLVKQPGGIIKNDWDFKRVVWTLLDKGDKFDSSASVWNDYAVEQGWTCAHCIKGPLVNAIENRVKSFDTYNPPCRRFNSPEVNTCDQYVGADEVPVITLPTALVEALPDSVPGLERLHTTLLGGGSYVEHWTAFTDFYSAARIALKQTEERNDADAKAAHLLPLRQYWEAQVEARDGLDIHDFQSHACHKCAHYELANLVKLGAPCQYIAEPLRNSHNGTRAPQFGVLVDTTGRPVPRCEQFRFAEMPEITNDLPGFAAGEAAPILLDWYRRLSETRSSIFFGNILISGVLAWLPNGKPRRDKMAAVVAGLSPAETLTLLNIGIHEAAALNQNSWDASPFTLAEPNGRITTWKPMPWRNFAEKYKHYKWGDYPIPWAVRQADKKKKAA